MVGNRITRCFRHGLAMSLATPPRNPTIEIVGGVKCAVVMNVVLPHFGQGPIFRLAVIVVNSFLFCVRANKKKADSPESESAFIVRDCELYERKTRLVDDIYRTTKSLCRSQAASTKNHLLNSKRHQCIKNRPTKAVSLPLSAEL